MGRSVALAALTVVLAIVGGCSGDDQPPPGARVTCEEACARCSVSDLCPDCAGYAMRFRDEFENALYACVMQQDACSHDWESCVSAAIAAAPARDLDRMFRDACLARRTECQNQGMGFADDSCLTSGAFTTEIVNHAQQCLTKACGEISGCFNELFR